MSNHQSPQTGSTLPTPLLSPTITADPSPAFSTVLKSPSTSVLELKLDSDGPSEREGWRMPECWGHRGASATFPENTRASFIEACKAGADGIETDIHITSDNRLVMFHDPELSRTTNGTGRIANLPWHDALEHIRTIKSPHQPIPLFSEVLDLLMDPSRSEVKLNIDCKVENDPVKLFSLIRDAVEKHDGWATRLAPRIILGIWHPKFILPATELLPYLPRYAISMSLPQVRQYFFDSCHGFSVRYEALASPDGAMFRAECRKQGKWICVWTVNDREEMRECARWGVRSVISDKPALWEDVKAEIGKDRDRALKPTIATYVLPFLQKKNWWFDYERLAREETEYLEREGGKFDEVTIPKVSLRIARPADSLV